jgi:ribosomal protein S18 acetylase RimI-like enzyme
MRATAPVFEDAHGIATAQVRSWQLAYAAILPKSFLISLSIEERAGRWRAILEAKESTTLVAKSDSGMVVGFVSFGRCRDDSALPTEGEIWSLYAAPEYWDRGVGRLLLGRALVQLHNAGHESVSLWVLSKNERGRRFYAAAGFKMVPQSTKRIELAGIEVDEVRLLRRCEA